MSNAQTELESARRRLHSLKDRERKSSAATLLEIISLQKKTQELRDRQEELSQENDMLIEQRDELSEKLAASEQGRLSAEAQLAELRASYENLKASAESFDTELTQVSLERDEWEAAFNSLKSQIEDTFSDGESEYSLENSGYSDTAAPGAM
ncbi:hypothetical protein [Salipiger sp. PrR003]|uniref:hypothetical protein n=1 Tax=Salipiger sp. PrR003 TaxID=2706776 RepID=UPI0013DB8110|nr:hypothetical protein [Salipiger sp. PrR003]NDV52893.1 hypothetical protein [Salipiger sp. PrR003]